MSVFAALLLQILLLSLLAFGTVAAVLPELHRFLVEQHALLSEQQFGALYALSQAAPGPNVLYIALFGLQIAGLGGALACTLAMITPSSLLALAFERYAGRHADARWHRVLRGGLAPLTIGFVAASGWLLAQGEQVHAATLALTAVCALVHWRTRLNPVWLVVLGAALGVLGLV